MDLEAMLIGTGVEVEGDIGDNLSNLSVMNTFCSLNPSNGNRI